MPIVPPCTLEMATIQLRIPNRPSSILRISQLASSRVLLRSLSRRCYWSYGYGKPTSSSYISKSNTTYSRLSKYNTSKGSSGYIEYTNSGLGARAFWSWGPSGNRDERNKEEYRAQEEKRNRRNEHEEFLKQFLKKWKHYRSLLKDDPLKYQDFVNEIVKKDPYATLFGFSEVCGVWNPWRGDSRTIYSQYMKSRRKMSDKAQDEAFNNGAKSQTTSSESTPHPDSSSPLAKATKSSNSNVEQLPDDYIIDPITLRKIARSQSTGATSPTENRDVQRKVTEISGTNDDARRTLMKKFSAKVRAMKAQQNTPTLSGFASQPWLVREGFVDEIKAMAKVKALRPPRLTAARLEDVGKSREVGSTKIESALDRISASNKKDHKLPQYSTEENRTEDIDLLRASDVRAASGHTKKPSLSDLEDRESKQEMNRLRLEKLFGLNQSRIDSELSMARPFVDKARSPEPSKSRERYCPENKSSSDLRKTGSDDRYGQSSASKTSANRLVDDSSAIATSEQARMVSLLSCINDQGPTSQNPEPQELKELTSKIQNAEKQYAEQQQYFLKVTEELKNLKQKAAGVLLSHEVEYQKAKMEAHETKPRTSESFAVADTASPVPSYANEFDASQKAAKETKRREKLRDKALYRELRAIYEDRYGTISTEHRQPNERGPIEQSVRMKEPDLPVKNSAVENTDRKKEPPSSMSHGTVEPPIEAVTNQNNGSTDLVRSREQNLVKNPDRRPRTYKVLTLNDTQEKVVVAQTTSSLYESQLRSPTAILTHLQHPFKYFESMKALEDGGYELIAGNRRMLVFRKIVEEQPNTLPVSEVHSSLGGLETRSSHQVSPSKASSPPSTSSRVSHPSSRLVRRQELVFSGTPTQTQRILAARNRESERMARRRLARMKETTTQPPSSSTDGQNPRDNGEKSSVVARLAKKLYRGTSKVVKIAAAIFFLTYAAAIISDVLRGRRAENSQNVEVEPEGVDKGWWHGAVTRTRELSEMKEQWQWERNMFEKELQRHDDEVRMLKRRNQIGRKEEELSWVGALLLSVFGAGLYGLVCLLTDKPKPGGGPGGPVTAKSPNPKS